MVTPVEQAGARRQSDSSSELNRKPAWREWIAGCCLAAVLLSIIAGYVPPPLKKLGLYFLFCGGLMGWLTKLISRECGITSRRVLRLAGFVLALAVLLNISWLSTRAMKLEARTAFESSPEARLAQSFVSEPDANPEMQEAFRKRYHPGFLDYLEVRVSPLGKWTSPWPALFWGVELLVGSVCGGWLAGRSSGRI